MAGVDLRGIQELMGYKTIATVRYAHLAAAHKLDAVQRLVKPRDTATDTGTTAKTLKQSRPSKLARRWRMQMAMGGLEPPT